MIPPPDDEGTLADAIRWLRRQLAEGANCPCCGQHAKLYKRPINASMAYVLAVLARELPEVAPGEPCRYVHVPSFIAEHTRDFPRRAAAVRGDWAKLRFWGLIEEMPDIPRIDGSPRAGYYAITYLGRQFLRNEAAVPAYVYLYNERVVTAPTLRELGIEIDTRVVRIEDVWGKQFDFREVMSRC